MLKRTVKLLISSFVYAADLLTDLGRRLVGRPLPLRAVVLYYHGISPTERPAFDRQMRLLSRFAVPFDCSRPILPGGGRRAAVTFDDGFVSVLENALPILRRERIPAVIFVPSGYLGGQPGWLKNGKLLARNETVAGPEQLRAVASDPLFIIGSHTVSHPRTAELSAASAERELRDSKAVLESATGHPVTLFSFPHGSFGHRDLKLARVAGYTRVFGIHPALAFSGEDEYMTGRVAVDPSDWPCEFLLKLLGAYRWQGPKHIPRLPDLGNDADGCLAGSRGEPAQVIRKAETC